MNNQRILSRWVLVAIVLLLLAECAPQQQIAMGGTRAWIDVPRDRSVISLKPHAVMAHASDAAGLVQVELVVNGASVGSMNCENLAQPLVTCRGEWTPLVPGDYRLEAWATNPSGNVGASAPVFVTIGEISPPPGVTPLPPSVTPPPPQIITITPMRAPTLTPTPTLTATPLGQPPPGVISPPPQIISITPPPPLPPTIITNTPTPTQTSAPVCPGAPIIPSFTASHLTITQGQSSTLSWGSVSNATSVEIDHGIGEVPTPGSRVVSPNSSTTYMITATGCGGTVTRQVTISVTAPPTSTRTRTPTRTPTSPPPQPPAAPSKLHQVSRSCTTPDRIRIAWNDNSNNESGFRIYHRARNPDTIWALVATVGANATQYTDAHSFSKFKTIEYAVEAYNNADSSARATLSVGECID